MGSGCARSPMPPVAGIGDHAVADALLCLPRPTWAVAGDLESSGPAIGRDAGHHDGPSWLAGWHADRRQRLAASPGQSLPTGAAVGGVGPCPRRRQDRPRPRGDSHLDGALPRDPTATTLPLRRGPAEVVEATR